MHAKNVYTNGSVPVIELVARCKGGEECLWRPPEHVGLQEAVAELVRALRLARPVRERHQRLPEASDPLKTVQN